jgi:hypothetical protein
MDQIEEELKNLTSDAINAANYLHPRYNTDVEKLKTYVEQMNLELVYNQICRLLSIVQIHGVLERDEMQALFDRRDTLKIQLKLSNQ